MEFVKQAFINRPKPEVVLINLFILESGQHEINNFSRVHTYIRCGKIQKTKCKSLAIKAPFGLDLAIELTMTFSTILRCKTVLNKS